MNIVIVGHIDHGKSTLIGRLLFDTNSIPESVIEEAKRSSKRADGNIEFAYLLDSLEEERAKNITIDTSRTFFKTSKRPYTIIDAPGHKEFLKNMVTGASRADAAILIVDASRGVEEQTKRHAFVLKLLGVNKLVVAVNKLDLVDFDEEKYKAISQELNNFFASLEITPSAMVPIAAMDGDNLAKRSTRTPWYSGPTVVEVLDGFEERSDLSKGPLRFATQCSIAQGDEKVVLGRVESGTLKPGQSVISYPSKKALTIKAVKIMNGELQSAEAGRSIGLTVQGDASLERGSIVCEGGAPTVTKSFKSSLFCLSPAGLSTGKDYTLKCATQAVRCKIKEIHQKMNSSSLESTGQNASSIDNTEVGEVIIETTEPIVVEDFVKVPALGRFVLQDQEHISAAGIIREASL